MGPVRYDAPLDSDVKLVTGVTTVILGTAAVGLVAGFGRDLYARFGHPAVLFVPLVFLVTPGILLLAVRGEAPTGYTVDDDAIRIQRRVGPVTIPLSSIREVRELPRQASFVRTGGSGGFLGFYGEFRSPDLGSVTMYATRAHDRVLLAAEGRNWVVTPADPAAFVADVRSRIRRD